MGGENKPEKEKTSKSYKRYFVVVVFVVLSSLLWLMNKLTQDYIVTLRFAPKLKNSETATIYTDLGDNTLFAQIKAPGFFILRERFLRKTEIEFDVKDMKGAREQRSRLHVPTSLLKDKFQEFFDTDIHVSLIEPDTIYFTVSKNAVKTVPVTAILDLTFGSEYRQSGPVEFSPAEVTLSGSEKDLAQITEVKAVIDKLYNVTKTMENVAVLSVPDNVAVKPKKVRYKIPVDRCTECTITVPVTILNVPKNTSVTLLPASVSVQYTIPLKHYTKGGTENFAVAIDFNDTKRSLTRKVKVSLEHKPAEAFDISIEPEFIEAIVQTN